MSIRVVTDSTCDLPQEDVKRHGITVVPMYINAGERGYLDAVEMSRDEFYRRLPEWDPAPTTGIPSPDVFQQVYRQLAREGATHILSIHLSSSLSGVVGVAQAAAEQTPSVPVTVVDSRQLSLGLGFLLPAAAQAAAAGRTAREILEMLKSQIARTHVFAALDTLEYLRRSGRMGSAMARLGSILRIRPLLKMFEGQPLAERVRTHEGAVRRMIELLKERAPFEKMSLVYTDALEKAEALRERLAEFLPSPDVAMVQVTPVIGAHVGPGAVGVAAVSTA
jgi:DegV family protein with EDD domain